MAPFNQLCPFDIRELEVFLAVCETGAMSSAARQLGITQPSVSQTVAEMEQRVGLVFFDRRVRPLGLTPAGAVLRSRASMLIAEARQIGPLLRQAARGRVSFLRIGLVDSLTRTLSGDLAGFLAEVAEQASVFSGLTASHVAALLTRQLDLFLGAQDVEDVGGLERHLLLQEAYVLLCPDGMAPPTTLAELAVAAAERPLIRYSARSATGLEIERHLRRLRLEPPRHLEFDTPHGVSAAVAAGLGWAITTPLCVREAALPGSGTARHPLPGPKLTRRLVLIARQRELGSIPHRMAEHCRRVLEKATEPNRPAQPGGGRR